MNLKSKMEDQRKQEFGQAVSALEQERERLSRLEAQRSQTISSFREEIREGINPGRTNAHNNFLRWLKESIHKQANRVRQAEAEVERRRAVLAEAMKERKMLETLKDKHYTEFVYEQNLAEQKTADEIVSFRHGSKEN